MIMGGKRTVRMSGVEFVRRFLRHGPLSGLKRIRHYGVLTSSCKAVKLHAARLALQMPGATRT
ncbi:MAG: transposase [Burkholderiales bacterium]|nr:transposase [Burkholderiales bacterium]